MKQPLDTYRHKGLRNNLMELLRTKGITDTKVLEGIATVPRHFFFDTAFLEFAYEDNAFPIAAGQTISQPYTVAFQTQLLEVQPGMKVLEVGSGSGYQASILAFLGAKVFTIERQQVLYEKLRSLQPPLDYKIRLFFGDGYAGLPELAPFDRILITAAAPSIPESLIAQLKPGGILVAPVGKGDEQTMTVVHKDDQGRLSHRFFGTFRFVPMLANKANDK